MKNKNRHDGNETAQFPTSLLPIISQIATTCYRKDCPVALDRKEITHHESSCQSDVPRELPLWLP
jgi:hypothetical protein